ncbi:MAG: DUF4870 domain-containing protein [Schleiferilactobacillus perolens]|jgi:uncharacterized Tic20 family protein|uniref:DUF4870 domain-containing protein n=1 Tax=Schleiferilactobacillus perolens TaxID=100468 RepID=UPI000708F8CF|nr:DUF4870 domain-containing protein [Schleiferilactobacillus perolens]MCI1891466.1 DUF4870 domain-containing protein [Schleiferilactobacillus harbinensis]MCI1913853.1 DUF4870 domain-containing protein [Schleiferilactobacillus harbinensis]
MNEHRILRALCYISVLFAPFLFPLIVWIVTDKGSATQSDAKTALWLHIIPFLMTIGIFFLVGVAGLASNSVHFTAFFSVPLMIVFFVVDLGLVIYNLYKGIKILAEA